jgi:hypothetical protein
VTRKRGTRRIVDYVISLSGRAYGTPLMDNLDRRFRTPSRAHADKVCADANSYSSNPTARVLPVVRYELDREEERLRDAVVEAAIEVERVSHMRALFRADFDDGVNAELGLEFATRALRSHLEKKG